MKKSLNYLFFILIFSCNDKNASDEYQYQSSEIINNWYYKKSPTYDGEYSLRKDKKNKKILTNIVHFSHNIPKTFILEDEIFEVVFVNPSEALITISYVFKKEDLESSVFTDTYYFDRSKDLPPILLKSKNYNKQDYYFFEKIEDEIELNSNQIDENEFNDDFSFE